MNILDNAPILVVAIPLLASFSVMLIEKKSKNLRNIIALLAVTASMVLTLALASDIINNGPKAYVFGAEAYYITLPSGYSFPVRIIFELDAMSAYMATITSILSFAAVVYSLSYMKHYTSLGRYYTLLLILTAAIYGMEFTGDLFNLFVFLEITSIAACALVAFRVDKGTAAEAGFKTMTMYTISALFFLLAVSMLYGEHNALNIAKIASDMKTGYNMIDRIALVLFLTSLALKLGAAPLHTWVPDAYGEAPSPISIILVSNTQASLYALFRICFTLYGLVINTVIIGWVIIFLGLMSMFIGATMALRQRNIKRLIAYTSVSQVGYMLLGVGVGITTLKKTALIDYGMDAIVGGIFHIFNDALCIGLLFLVAGAISYRTGAYYFDEMSGLARRMKYTTTFFIVSAAAIAGLPPFNGFASKLIIYESVYRFNPILSIIAILISIITLANFVIVFHGAFLGPRLKKSEEIREAPDIMVLTMFMLAALIILIGLFPGFIVKNFAQPAADALINQEQYIKLVMDA